MKNSLPQVFFRLDVSNAEQFKRKKKKREENAQAPPYRGGARDDGHGFLPIVGGFFRTRFSPNCIRSWPMREPLVQIAPTNGRRRNSIGRRLRGLTNRSSLNLGSNGALEESEELFGAGGR